MNEQKTESALIQTLRQTFVNIGAMYDRSLGSNPGSPSHKAYIGGMSRAAVWAVKEIDGFVPSEPPIESTPQPHDYSLSLSYEAGQSQSGDTWKLMAKNLLDVLVSARIAKPIAVEFTEKWGEDGYTIRAEAGCR